MFCFLISENKNINKLSLFSYNKKLLFSPASVPRDDNLSSASASSRKRPICKYGATCYRKNPIHLAEFYHPDKADDNSSSPTSK